MVGNRYESRKRKKMSRILNIAIGVVILLIVVVGLQIFLNGGNNNEVANTTEENNAEDGSNQTGSTKPGIKDPASKDSSDDNATSPDEDEDQDSVADGRTEDDDDTDADNADEDEDLDENGQEDEEQDSLGTEQTGEFSPDFTKGSQNWNEMVAAVGSPQGLSSEGEMTLWRLENGGSPTTAVGTFSDKNEEGSYSNPYRVTIEWQDGEGWKVVSSEQLSSNPYR